MDQRLLKFIFVSLVLFFVYMELLQLMGVTKPRQEEDAVAEVGEDGQGQDPVVGDPATPVDPADAAREGDPPGVARGNDNVDAEANPVERAVVPLARFTLGSVDPADGFPFLITFINRGGAVERIEMSNPRYRNLTDKTAYIGHLAVTASDQGATVGVVGRGTPAAKAGIQVNDVLIKVDAEPVVDANSLDRALRKFKFGASFSVTLLRDGQEHVVEVTSIRRPLEVIRPEPEPAVEGEKGHPSAYLLTLHTIGNRSTQPDEDELPNIPSLRTENWQANHRLEQGLLEFRFALSAADLRPLGVTGAVEIVKRFRLLPPDANESANTAGHDFQFEVELVNQGDADLPLGYRLDGATGLPLEGWWYSYKTRPGFWAWGAAGVRDIVWKQQGGVHGMYANALINDQVKQHNENPQEVQSPHPVIADQETRFGYLGVDAQYFNSALLPIAAAGDAQATPQFQRVTARAVGPVDTKKSNRTDVTFRADAVALRVPAGKTITHGYRVFAGPKHVDVLAKYGLGECIVYGWFKWPAQFMGVLLHALHAVVRNYGIAIILLTLIVRACMFPIGRQMAMNAKKMQELSPEIRKIKEKFPGDTEKQARAQQELFRKHNYNPLAGCLPMFIQIPIFIGLYRALSVDIDLRQTPLIPGLSWCSNLAGPDMLFRWDTLIPWELFTGYTGWLGPYFNILPVLSAAVFIFHQKLFTPPPTDEQQEVQQKVMMFMPVMMCFFFFRMPAGLNLYFITSSLWALGERLMLPKDLKPQAGAPQKKSLAAALTGGGDSSGGGSATAVAAKKKRRKRSKGK